MKANRFFAVLWLINIGIVQAYAESFWKSNIQYSVLPGVTNEVEVIGNEVTTSQITIPQQVTYEGVTYTVTSIGNNALENCTCSSIVIPTTVKSIGNSAFKGANFQSVTIPSAVTTIKASTFENCRQLTSVTLHNNITEIGNSAFSGCYALTGITLPSKITEISESCFASSGLQSISFGTKIKVIKSNAFANCTSLNNVSVPNNVEDIEESVFYNCSNLSQVTLGSGIKHIGNQAFYQTPIFPRNTSPYARTNIYIGKYLIYAYNPTDIKEGTILIADKACWLTQDCRNTPIIIPASVKYVGNQVFISNTYIYEVEFLGVETLGDEIFTDGSLEVYSKGTRKVILPPTIKKIGDNTFPIPLDLTYNKYQMISYEIYWNIKNYPDFTLQNRPIRKDGNTKFIIGDDVEHIPAYLCYKQIVPSTFNLPSNLKSIGAYAFCECSIPSHIDFPNMLDSIGAYAFSGCNTLTHLEIPDNIVYIGESAFANCSNVTQVDLGTGLNEIKDGVFRNCSKLDHIFIPNNITKLGNEAFQNCLKLTRLTNPSNSLTSIGDRCFQKCTTLVSFDIPISVQTLGAYAFANCTALTAITWGQNLSALQNGTFAECSKLANVELTDNIISIGDSCFYNCVKLSNFKGNKLQHLGSAAFANCTTLKTFTFEDQITSIGNNLFNGCSALKTFTWNVPQFTFSQYTPFYGAEYDIRANIDTVHFGNMAENIPPTLCIDMKNLKKIFVGSNVNNMTYRHIQGCNNLQEINVDQNNSTIASKDGVVFSADTTELKVYPPAKTGSTYSIPLPVEDISDGAFFNCLKLTSMKIENSVQSIGNSAFEGCMKLSSITLGENVEVIGKRAFYNDSILSSITSNVINIPSLYPDAILYYRPKTQQEVDPTRRIHLYIAEHRQAEYKAMPIWKNMIMVTHRAEGIWKVTWKDWNNTVLKEEYVENGEAATPPDEPSRDGYIFIGWDKTYDNIISDLVIKALYQKEDQGIEDILDRNDIRSSKILYEGQIYLLCGDKVYTPTGIEVQLF